MDEFLSELFCFLDAVKHEFLEQWEEVKRQLNPVLEVCSGIIMAVPVILIVLWLLGF